VKCHKHLDFPLNAVFHLSNPLKIVKCCIKPLNGHFPKYNLRFGNLNLKSNTDKNKDEMAECMKPAEDHYVPRIIFRDRENPFGTFLFFNQNKIKESECL